MTGDYVNVKIDDLLERDKLLVELIDQIERPIRGEFYAKNEPELTSRKRDFDVASECCQFNKIIGRIVREQTRLKKLEPSEQATYVAEYTRDTQGKILRIQDSYASTSRQIGKVLLKAHMEIRTLVDAFEKEADDMNNGCGKTSN